ncbi:tubulin-specific chaperone E isoform X2 [Neodiprion lecontei]|uniref:Tubulin-specific chaperone E n=1 Tax=Neodiprion lecontei TaxID=441921 RepID=A0ABM3GN48_NEOLC|nr:tubulin-specific chaperone E isoform X2 [Neodiprion lecontei]
MVEDKNYELGSRIECDGSLGTLRYVGPVGDTKGEWLGIDWDDPSRGKHNGTYEGVKYFTTWHPTSGSFIRHGKANFGISCPDAIKSRYGLINDDLAGIDRENLTSLQKEINAPFLEMVGFSKVNKKQSKFDQLEIIWLRDQSVSNAGNPGELETLCPRLKELDISRNLTNSWKVISDICIQLRSLTRLNVSENKLPCDIEVEQFRKSFSNVTHLTMARMNYNWADVQRCIAMFPSIRELSISFNIWRSISELDKLLSLQDLKFRDNPILKCGTPETTRQLIIARISKLKFLNGTEVWQDERTGAEYDYLKLFGKQWLDTESIPEKRVEFITEHPQYPSLIKKYGLPDVHVSKLNAGMGSNVISVEFICPDDPNQPQRVRRKLLKDMEVQKVVGIVQRLFKTSGKIPTLSFVQQTLSSNEIKLDKPLQNLSYFSIQDGDQILVRW